MTKVFQSKRQRARYIAARLAEGLDTDAIGKEIGMTGRSVRKIAARFGIIMHTPNARRFAFFCGRRRTAVIQALAEQAGVSPSTMIDRIVSTVVDDGIDHARKRLGTLAMPAEKTGVAT